MLRIDIIRLFLIVCMCTSDLPAASPDFPSVYSFIGSVFDASCGMSDHKAKLMSMAAVDRETVSQGTSWSVP